MDLHALGGDYCSKGLLLHIMLYFVEAIATIRGRLLNKGGVYSRKYGIYLPKVFNTNILHGYIYLLASTKISQITAVYNRCLFGLVFQCMITYHCNSVLV